MLMNIITIIVSMLMRTSRPIKMDLKLRQTQQNLMKQLTLIRRFLKREITITLKPLLNNINLLKASNKQLKMLLLKSLKRTRSNLSNLLEKITLTRFTVICLMQERKKCQMAQLNSKLMGSVAEIRVLLIFVSSLTSLSSWKSCKGFSETQWSLLNLKMNILSNLFSCVKEDKSRSHSIHLPRSRVPRKVECDVKDGKAIAHIQSGEDGESGQNVSIVINFTLNNGPNMIQHQVSSKGN